MQAFDELKKKIKDIETQSLAMDGCSPSFSVSDILSIIDSLMALRNIYESGCCNDCTIKKICKYAPKAGQLVRYNCPFYERREE